MTRVDPACPDCRAALAADQRYCLDCGRRVGPQRLDWRALLRGPAVPAAALSAAPARRPLLPTPRVAATLLLVVMGFGVVVAGAAGPSVPRALASSALPLTIILPSAPAPAPAPAATPAPAPAPAPAPTPAPAASPAPSPSPAPAPASTTPSSDKPVISAPTTTAPVVPAVHHVFVISLGAGTYDAWFGPQSTVPYLAQELAAQGTLLSGYRATSDGELANEITAISGQSATTQTEQNCPTYSAVTPGTVDDTGQAAGDGCVYSQQAYTLPDQLTAAGDTWKAYVEGQDAPGATPASCRHPADGQADPDGAPRGGDPYVTWRNPFVYFQTITTTPDCATDDVGLTPLATDLAKESTTASVSWIAPETDHDTPATADAWLRTVVPEILTSRAYADGGLLAIVPDASGSVDEPIMGALLLSKWVAPGAVITTPYDHLSLLRSVEDLFSLRYLAGAGGKGVRAFDHRVYARFYHHG